MVKEYNLVWHFRKWRANILAHLKLITCYLHRGADLTSVCFQISFLYRQELSSIRSQKRENGVFQRAQRWSKIILVVWVKVVPFECALRQLLSTDFGYTQELKLGILLGQHEKYYSIAFI